MTVCHATESDEHGVTCVLQCRCGYTKVAAVEGLLLCPRCDHAVLRQAAESVQKPPT